MNDYRSIRHASANENGEEEIQLESPWPLWKSFWLAIADPSAPDYKTETYVFRDHSWADKVTGAVPNAEKQGELFECKDWLARQSRMNDFFGAYK